MTKNKDLKNMPANEVVDLIQKSDLDQTIKDILIRDFQQEGMTDFIEQQIKSYCLYD